MDFIEAIPLGSILDGSGWAVAFWAVLYATRLVLKGNLVTRVVHDQVLQALATEQKRNELLLKQLEGMTDSMETFERFVRALPQPVPVPPARRGTPGPGKNRPRHADAAQWGDWDPPGGSA